MIAIDNNPALRYDDVVRNRLTTAVSWAMGGSDLGAAGTVTFAAPTSGVTATGTPILKNGYITGVTITNPGSGYTAPPVATFSAANVTGTTVLTGGALSSVLITNSGGRTFTATDNTVYPSAPADSRAAANFGLYDRFGNVYKFSITSGNSVTVSIGTKLLNIAEGLAAEVTITSTLKKIKDGTAFHIGTLNTAGVFVMEK